MVSRVLPFPQSFRTRVKYQRGIPVDQFTVVNADTSVVQFLGNSIYNPDLSILLENYPIGVTEIAALYARYMVRSCKLTFKVQCTDSNLTSNGRYAVWAHPYTRVLPSGFSSADDLVGQTLASKMMSIGPVNGISVSQPFSRRFTTAQVLARPEIQILRAQDVSGYCVDGSFQPFSQWFWTIAVTNDTGLIGQPNGLRFQVELEYDVEFYQPRALIASNHSTLGSFVANFPEPCPNTCFPLGRAESKEDPEALVSSSSPVEGAADDIQGSPLFRGSQDLQPSRLERQRAVVGSACGCHR